MSTRGARVVRGLVVAMASLLVASVAHLAAGGRIGAVGFALAFSFSTLAAIALSGRTVSWIRMSVAVLFAQGVFHVLLGIGTGTATATSTYPPAMAMAGMESASAQAIAPATAAGPIAAMPDDGWMWAAHAAAAVLTILGLVLGERSFWRLAEWVTYSIRRVLMAPTVCAPSGPTPLEPIVDRVTLRLRLLLAGTERRGPPRLVASS